MGYKFCPSFCLLVVASFLISTGHGATVELDVDSDVQTPWNNQCVSGYHHLETFSCDQGPLIPAPDFNGQNGFWARCSVFFVPRCDIYYRPVTDVWKVIRIEAYFHGGASIEVTVEHGSSFTTRLLQGSPGWQTVSLDISNLSQITEIKVSPEFQGANSFTVIDKIILDDAVPVPTTTTTTTTDPPTPDPTTEEEPEQTTIP